MKILIPVDGSAHTQRAVDYLAKHRSMFVDGNQLIVVHVCVGVPGHVTRLLSKEVVLDYYAEEAAVVLNPLKEALAKNGITDYTIDQRHGHAAEEILKAAKISGAELIVMGTRGQGLLGRAIMGSVATKVVSETNIPVLLVQ